MRVLIVDDEPHVISSLRRLLGRHFHQVLDATSGEQALEVLARESVDVVVSDHRMDGMDGTELLLEIGRRWPEIGRILLSGFNEADSSHPWAVLPKPWNNADIVLRIESAGRKRR